MQGNRVILRTQNNVHVYTTSKQRKYGEGT